MDRKKFDIQQYQVEQSIKKLNRIDEFVGVEGLVAKDYRRGGVHD